MAKNGSKGWKVALVNSLLAILLFALGLGLDILLYFCLTF
jgi:hypothetical protein